MKQAGQEVSETELKDMIKAVDRNGKEIVLLLLLLLLFFLFHYHR